MSLKELVQTVFTPVRVLLSSTALRTYLRLVLALVTSILLLVVAVAAYLFFHARFIPLQSVRVPVHLEHPLLGSTVGHDFTVQDEHGQTAVVQHYPRGTAQIPGNTLVEGPYYDIIVELELPRSPVNLNAGNFMVEIALLAENERWRSSGFFSESNDAAVVANATNPAILTYWSPPVDIVRKLLRLPAFALGWRREAEKVRVRIFKELRFGSGIISRYIEDVPLPDSLILALKSRAALDVYHSTVIFSVRLRGLRYFMHNHRITSFVIFTTLFFIIEVTFALTAWAFLSIIYTSSRPRSKDQAQYAQIKQAKNGARFTSTGIKREDEYDDNLEDEDQQHAVTHVKERMSIKKEDNDDDDEDYPQSLGHTFPAFPQRRRRYSSTSSTSASRSWPQSRSLSATKATPVRIKKEEAEEVECDDEEGGGDGDRSLNATTASSSGRDNSPGAWSMRLERVLDARRRQEAARRRRV